MSINSWFLITAGLVIAIAAQIPLYLKTADYEVMRGCTIEVPKDGDIYFTIRYNDVAILDSKRDEK